MTILLEAAIIWRHLQGYKYRFVGARKMVQYEIVLTFCDLDFYHLAGFQYLRDVPGIYKTSKEKTIEAVINGKITLKDMEKSQNYETLIKPRLLSLCGIENTFEQDFKLYKFNPKKLPFYSDMDGEYLIYGENSSGLDYVFVSKQTDMDTFFCRSTFIEKPTRKFCLNQTPLCLLHKSKKDIRQDTIEVFINRIP